MTRSIAARTPARIRASGSNTTRSNLLQVYSSLQDRDIDICLALHERKILTTHQINELFFGSYSRTRARLIRLYRAGVVDRFAPPVERGSSPQHYILGEFGARLVAGELGIDPKEVLRSINRLANLVRSQRLRHFVETNGFFTRLVWACRQLPNCELSEWQSEDKLARLWGGILQPDGFGRLQAAGRTRSFFLELDRGTENLQRLSNKLPGYLKVFSVKGHPDLILFCFTTQPREASARRFLKIPGVSLATTTIDRHHSDPLGRIWLPTTNGRRHTLLEVNGHA